MAQQPNPERAKIQQRALQIAGEADSYLAFAFLESQDDPIVVAADYGDLVRHLYYEKKDIPRMLLFGRAGIQYCLSQAGRLQSMDAERATKLKGIAKSIAFNLGANTWPGWGDEGVTITERDRDFGMDAARLNLRLARELERDANVMGNAYWLLGAHLFAAGQAQEAIDAFALARQEFDSCGNGACVLKSMGYAALTRKSLQGSAREGEEQLQAILEDLEANPAADAKFFAEQLRTVEKNLLHNPSSGTRAQSSRASDHN